MKKNLNTLFVGMSFLVIGLIGGLLISGEGKTSVMDAFGLSDGAVQDTTATAKSGAEIAAGLDPSQLEEVSVSVDDDPFMGDPNAPITIVEFSDFQCPYCSKFVFESMETLTEEYINTGLVKLVFRDFPLPSHKNASLAAQAAECVRTFNDVPSDDLYFQMHDLLFDSQSKWVPSEDAEGTIIDLAVSNLGVDGDALKTCIDSGEMKAEVEADYTAGKGYGITGTPTFFINGKKLVGAWPVEVFVKVIDSLK